MSNTINIQTALHNSAPEDRRMRTKGPPSQEKGIEHLFHCTLIGTVAQKYDSGVIVDIGSRWRAFLHVSRLIGAGPEERKARLRALAVGEKIPVRVMNTQEGVHHPLIWVRELYADLPKRASEMVGTIATGIILTKSSFGVRVAFGGGLEGLVHVSDLGSTSGTQAERLEALRLRSRIKVKVVSVANNLPVTRLCLSEKEATRERLQDATLTGVVQAQDEHGFLVGLGRGLHGRLGLSDLVGTGRQQSLAIGDKVTVTVTSVRDSRQCPGQLRIALRERGEVDAGEPAV